MNNKVLHQPNLKELAGHHEDGTVSLYLPLEAPGSNPDAHRIRIKNVVSMLQDVREEYDLDQKSISSIEKSLLSLNTSDLNDGEATKGLAVFLSLRTPEELKVIPLYEEPKYEARIGKEFYLSGLLHNVSDQKVMLLCLSDNSLRLFRGENHHLEEISLAQELPSSLEDVIRFEKSAGLDGNESYRNRTGAGSMVASHGEAPHQNIEDEFQRRYYREIGEALRNQLKSDEKIVLGAVHEKAELFKEINSDLPIIEDHAQGNFEGLSTEKVLDEFRSILTKAHEQETSKAFEDAMNLSPDRRLNNLEKVIEAAQKGSVENLYIKGQPEDPKLLEKAIHAILETGGQIRRLDPNEEEAEVMATLRWA